ncbi:hypothetical protein TIFTF001_009904 [Ficus carica]|uniref:Uncharacterized protein n=1 Tax=Ficus carica TaxID=3494 RepID=A0AA88AHZ8_FICCA|nr:hypothetical protein TIFTF001_009904 [Ficus carica]
MRADVCFNSCVNCRRICAENVAAILIAILAVNCTSWHYFERAKRRFQLIFVGTIFLPQLGGHVSLGLCPKGLVQLERQLAALEEGELEKRRKLGEYRGGNRESTEKKEERVQGVSLEISFIFFTQRAGRRRKGQEGDI